MTFLFKSKPSPKSKAPFRMGSSRIRNAKGITFSGDQLFGKDGPSLQVCVPVSTAAVWFRMHFSFEGAGVTRNYFNKFEKKNTVL